MSPLPESSKQRVSLPTNDQDRNFNVDNNTEKKNCKWIGVYVHACTIDTEISDDIFY